MSGPVKRGGSVMRIGAIVIALVIRYLSSSIVHHAIFAAIVGFRVSLAIVGVTVLRVIKAVVIINRRFFLNDLAFGAGAGHRRA